MNEPLRERPYLAQCGCLLKPSDRCPAAVSNPDQALCDSCLHSQHQNHPNFEFIPPTRSP